MSSVKGKPFSAQFVSSATERDGIHSHAEGWLYRDNDGRTRDEYRVDSGEQLAIIADPISGDLVFLDEESRIAQRGPGGGAAKGSGWAFSNCIPCYTDEYQLLLGVRCRRVLVKDAVDKKDAGELWVSDECMVVMRDSGPNHDWRVTRLERNDPSPSVFQIPPGYQISEEEL